MRKRGTALRLAADAPAEPSAPAEPAGNPPLPARRGSAPASLPTELRTGFTPVPRKYRHDGWTPERQKAFIEALADTGCVTRAAAMVNMAQANCYTLRRAPGAEEFRRAWDAALDFGLKRLKDLAFERAVEGELIPVFAAGKLMGFRRKRNDALLMFILRHYGHDGQGKRTTINYFSSRASAGAVTRTESPHPNPSPKGEGLSVAEASTTTVRTVISGAAEKASGPSEDTLNAFDGIQLDAEAQATIQAALEACAMRTREAAMTTGEERADHDESDPDEPFVALPRGGTPYRGELLPPGQAEGFELGEGDEVPWFWAGAEVPEPDMTPDPEEKPKPPPPPSRPARPSRRPSRRP